MGGLMRIEFNKAGFSDLLTSSAAKAKLRGEAERIAGRANLSPPTTVPAATEPYYEVEDGSDAERARYRVRTTGVRAARHEAKTQALQKAM
jgi:hypothetical protein